MTNAYRINVKLEYSPHGLVKKFRWFVVIVPEEDPARACSIANELRAFDCALKALEPEDESFQSAEPTSTEFLQIQDEISSDLLYEKDGWKVFKAPSA